MTVKETKQKALKQWRQRCDDLLEKPGREIEVMNFIQICAERDSAFQLYMILSCIELDEIPFLNL